jgi:uridine phosphorylase
MLRSYLIDAICATEIEDAFIAQTNWDLRKGRPYVIKGSETLAQKLDSPHIYKGFTGTVGGFYGPQGRVLRLGIQDSELNRKMDAFEYKGIRITNLEMETGAIYGLGRLMGHECLSLNAIIANRATGIFSENPYQAVNALIEYALDKLAN